MWNFVDERDPIGPTRYEVFPYAPERVEVWVYREGCKEWRLITLPTVDEAKQYIKSWVEQKHQED